MFLKGSTNVRRKNKYNLHMLVYEKKYAEIKELARKKKLNTEVTFYEIEDNSTGHDYSNVLSPVMNDQVTSCEVVDNYIRTDNQV